MRIRNPLCIKRLQSAAHKAAAAVRMAGAGSVDKRTQRHRPDTAAAHCNGQKTHKKSLFDFIVLAISLFFINFA